MKLKRLRRGNGVFIYGCFMLLLIYALVIGVIQTYAIRQMALKAQNAVDSIADGVWVFTVVVDMGMVYAASQILKSSPICANIPLIKGRA